MADKMAHTVISIEVHVMSVRPTLKITPTTVGSQRVAEDNIFGFTSGELHHSS